MKANAITRFHDRTDAGLQLGERLKERNFRDPLVLGIPRGGVVVGLALARAIGSELDVVLSRKLRAPYQPEYAIGAISEDGHATLNPEAADVSGASQVYLEEEKRYQLHEIARRMELFRSVRPPAAVAGRSVIVTDDGIATGSTMIAALQSLRAQQPHELIAAVPVAAPDRLEQVRRLCETVCLLAPRGFYAVGQFYDDFHAIEDEEVVAALRESAAHAVEE
jgi:putative phosphoribosyl transferase